MADLFQSRLDHDLKAITNALATYLTWSLQNSVTKHHDETEPKGVQHSVPQQSLTLEQPAAQFNPDPCPTTHGLETHSPETHGPETHGYETHGYETHGYETGHRIPQRTETRGDIIHTQQEIADQNVMVHAVIQEDVSECDRPE